MSTFENLRGRTLEITESHLVVELEDGSRYRAPITLFPILADATADERAHWEFIGGGSGIHWPDIDEHISVFSLVHPELTIPVRPEVIERHIRRNREERRVRKSA